MRGQNPRMSQSLKKKSRRILMQSMKNEVTPRWDLLPEDDALQDDEGDPVGT